MSAPDSISPRPRPGIGKCGHPRQGSPCKRPAGDRTDHHGFGHCWIHGGNSPTGRQWAARLKAESLIEERRQAYMFYRIEMPPISPEEVLLEEVHRSSAIVRWLEEMIDQWRIEPEDVDAEWARIQANQAALRDGDDPPDPDAALELVAKSNQTGLPKLGTVVYFDKGGTVAPTEVAAWLRVYGEERDRAMKAAKIAIDAGIAERLVKLAEREVDTIVAVIRASLQEMGLDLTPERVAIVGRQLRAIGGAAG